MTFFDLAAETPIQASATPKPAVSHSAEVVQICTWSQADTPRKGVQSVGLREPGFSERFVA